jgi:hypothetical protein
MGYWMGYFIGYWMGYFMDGWCFIGVRELSEESDEEDNFLWTAFIGYFWRDTDYCFGTDDYWTYIGLFIYCFIVFSFYLFYIY